MAHTRLAHGLARRPGRSGFGGLAGLSHLTRQQMEGQLVAGWPRMVERPRESASRTTSIRGLISPGPDRRVPESITRPSPRPVAWGLLPSDEPAARTGRQAHHPGRHGTAPTTGWLGMSSWRPPRSPWLRRFPSCFPGPCRPRPEQRGGSSVEVTNAGGRTAPPAFAAVHRGGFRRCVGEGARDNIYLLTRCISSSYSSMGRTVPAQRMLAEGAISQSILSKC